LCSTVSQTSSAMFLVDHLFVTSVPLYVPLFIRDPSTDHGRRYMETHTVPAHYRQVISDGYKRSASFNTINVGVSVLSFVSFIWSARIPIKKRQLWCVDEAGTRLHKSSDFNELDQGKKQNNPICFLSPLSNTG
jgi:hypothetical protein